MVNLVKECALESWYTGASSAYIVQIKKKLTFHSPNIRTDSLGSLEI